MDRLLLYGYLEELHEIRRHALDAVANDIIEEQGGLPDEASLSAPAEEDLPRLEPELPALSARPVASEPVVTPIDDNPDQRLAAVEQSMADLTGAVREQLALLRKALLSQRKGDDE